MKNRKYIKVSVSERLPEKEGRYVCSMQLMHKMDASMPFDPNDEQAVIFWNDAVEYWLQEVPDYEDEMKEMLEKAKKVLIHYSKNLKTTDPTIKEIEELLTKLKT
ncbi:UNVERIFIED_CONTAM: hypothetical protein POZ17_19875 [Ralstonia mannitolilytica]